MSILSAIENRRSIAVLADPAPNEHELALILRAAQHAPDHGRLKPWRFLLIKGDSRTALGQLYLKAAKVQSTTLSEDQQNRIANLPLRAPLIIVAIAQVIENHKVPVIEQIIATGAAVQNILLAVQALNYGAMWRTGEMAYNEVVKQGLGLNSADEIVAYLYVGTAGTEPKARADVDFADYCHEWLGPTDPRCVIAL